ncbi:hypothetical protein IQ07DRAFT_585699 [Pyrenochaeta sp. DS3sAY3a]|nr:hypothetical protein IQ07DRAFT_585699 [Pyrenochaeta sp. DS3sAY3a]
MSRQLSKKEAETQQLQQQGQYAQDVQTREHHAKADASAGLNLNLFGALSGALSSKSKKTTHHNADGSSISVEDRHDQAGANALASGRANAYAAGAAEQHSLASSERGAGQHATQTKAVKGKEERVDHLGIEG